jgi:hypothetical protein
VTGALARSLAGDTTAAKRAVRAIAESRRAIGNVGAFGNQCITVVVQLPDASSCTSIPIQ